MNVAISPATSAPTLTRRQRQTLQAIHRHLTLHGSVPSIRELAVALNVRSPNAVKILLDPLRAKGWLTWTDGRNRTIKLVGCRLKPVYEVSTAGRRLRKVVKGRWKA